MSEVDALFRLLTDAPPRSAEIVKRVALGGMGFPEVATLYGVDVPRAQVLVFRAFLDVLSGRVRVPDVREDAEVLAMVGSPSPFPASQGEGLQARKLWDQIAANRDELKLQLEKAAQEFAESPDRVRDEWLRRIAIVVVLALTAFFYVREQNKPHPPPQKRPTSIPTSPTVTPP